MCEPVDLWPVAWCVLILAITAWNIALVVIKYKMKLQGLNDEDDD